MTIVNTIVRPFFFFFFNENAGINVLLPDSLLICICHQIQRKRRDKKHIASVMRLAYNQIVNRKSQIENFHMV